MFALQLAEARPLRILCLGAHCDDIEIGCGGTLVELAQRHELEIHWIVLTGNDERQAEIEQSFAKLLQSVTNKTLDVARYRNSFLPYHAEAVKDYLLEQRSSLDPHVVFTHHRQDRHQDHRLISDLSWNLFRDHTILEYEIPKYDGDLGQPNLYCTLSDSSRTAKLDTVLSVYQSQRHRPWFSADTFNALMRLRGIECNSPSGHAEAFFARKLVLV